MNTHRVAVLAATIAATTLLAGCSAAAAPVAASHRPTAAATTPKATPTPVLGSSRQHPYPTGAPGSFDPTLWTFTYLSTNGNAWPTVQAFDPTNNPAPAAGTADVLATVKIDAGQADNPANPSSAVTYNYVGSDGNTYPIGACGNLGDQDLSTTSDMYAGATKTVLICSQVPAAAVTGGTWAVARNYVNSTTSAVFFQGA